MRCKARIKELELQLTSGPTGSTNMEPMCEDVSIPSVTVINTQDNVAYGHAQTLTTPT